MQQSGFDAILTYWPYQAKLLTDDNFKNQLQVKIQKEFKVTPEYIEINHDIDVDCFNNYYDTYRKIRMRDWHSFVAENKATLDHWWSKALEEKLI